LHVPDSQEQGVTDRFRVLHVCTANLCRSPLADRLMRQGLVERLGSGADQVDITSAGTRGVAGNSMEPGAVTALGAYGVDGTDFRARGLLADHVATADVVLTAAREHRACVVALQPRAAARTFTLREFDRLCAAVDPFALVGVDVPARGRALVRAAAARRGRVRPAAPQDDDLADPYGAPLAAFTACAQLVHASLQRPLDLLAGTRPDVGR